MWGAFAPPLILPADSKALVGVVRAVLRIGRGVPRSALCGDDINPDAPEQARRTGEVGVDEILVEPDRLESLGTGVRSDDRDAHLRHDLEHALAERLDQVVNSLLGVDAGNHPAPHELLRRLHREVRVDRRRSIPDQERDVMNLPHVSRFDDETDLHAVLGTDQVVMHRREHEQ